MKNKKNRETLGLDPLHPSQDPAPAEMPDELAATGVLPSVVVPHVSEAPAVTASPAELVDELAETGEFLPLNLNAELIRDLSASPSTGTGVRASPDDKVSFWLTHLASEIERLQAKWNQVDGELKVREARIEELQRDIAAKDVVAQKLTGDLTAGAAAQAESARTLASLETRLAALVSDQAQGEARLAERNQQLQAAKSSYSELQLQVAAARADVERLQERSAAQAQAAIAASERTRELLASNGDLRGTIEVLESYIDRRKQSWSEINARLTEYQDTLVTTEQAGKDKDRRAAEQEKTNEALSRQVRELEGRCAELTTRLKDRESAYEGLQAKLALEIKAASELRSELETRATKLAETAARLDRQLQLTAARERELAQRDAKIAELETARAEQNRSTQEAAAVSDQRATRVAELENVLQQRLKQIDDLNLELEERRSEARALTSAVSGRDARLARLEEAARADALTQQQVREQLDRVSRERTEVANALSVSQQSAAELELKISEAARETDRLTAQLAERNQQVAQLESDLVARQKALDLLDRNVQLINNLGASLQDLDRVFPGVGSPAERSPTSQPVAVEPTRAPTHRNHSVDSSRLMRKLLVALDEDGATYALDKDDMTIGRSAESDIVIRNPFISRVHARIIKGDAGTLIEDPGSRNGILVNGRQIERQAPLHDGDTISLGGALEFRYVDSPDRLPQRPTH